MSTKQDYDDGEESAHDAQRGVDKFDGANDHDGQLWHTFKDQVKDALATWSRRATIPTLNWRERRGRNRS